MKISLLVPTRGRPEFMRRVWTSAVQTAHNPDNLEICFFIDDDDHLSLDEYEKMESSQTKMISGDRGSTLLSEKWNEAYKVATGEIFQHCGDDLVFRSNDWDEIVVSKITSFPDRIVFVYGTDGYARNPNKLGTHGFIHKNWVDVVGYFLPPYFTADYNDTWLTEVANRIGRRIHVPEIYTEHMHWICGKAEQDQTYKDLMKRSRESTPSIHQIWNDKEPEREENAEKLLNFIRRFSP